MNKILSGLLLCLSVLSFTGCWGTTSTDTTTEEPEVVVTEPPQDTLDYYKVLDKTANLNNSKDRYNLANDSAKKWQADAKLLLVSTKYSNSLAETGVVDRFLFSSDIRPDLYFAIDIARDNIDRYTRNLIYVEDYALKSGVMPIPLKYWKTTANEALEIADAAGGAKFRKDNPNFTVTQVLSLAGGNNLAWYVVYEANNAEPFQAVIDTGSQTIIPVS